MRAKLEPEISSLTLSRAAIETAKAFASEGIETASLDARLLTAEACNLASETFIVERGRIMTLGEMSRLDAFRARRLRGEPVSRILGRREFWGLSFSISPAVLDPRSETELLVEIALDHVRKRGQTQRALRILDVGAGSGCILAALLTELPGSEGFGVDISFAAALQARRNLKALGLSHRATILTGDGLRAFAPASFDVIVSNPPYIPSEHIGALSDEVRLFDPRVALDGGLDGLNAYRSIGPQVERALRPGGVAIFETGYDQADKVAGLFSEQGLQARVHLDFAGWKRAVAAGRHLELCVPQYKKEVGNSSASL